MKIYTLMDTPFAVARRYAYVATEINPKEHKEFIVGKYNLLIVKNPIKKLFHCVWPECGAIVGTNKSKSALQAMIISDIAQAKKRDLKAQLEQAKVECKNASLLENNEFFILFSGEKRDD